MRRLTYREIRRLLGEIGVLQQECRRQAMVYQYQDKVAAARHFGVTFDAVDQPFADWMLIREAWLAATSPAVIST